MTSWDDVIARTRGLSSRLLGRAALERLCGARDLRSIAVSLETTAYASLVNLESPNARTLERETRRIAGRNLETIARWCGDRARWLAPVFEDEDRRNLRSLARATVANEPPDRRVAGLLPTPELPTAALEELAHSVRLADLAATLALWGNPYGAAMMPEASRETPNLFALQSAVDREYAARAAHGGPRAGEAIAAYVALVIDDENARAALAIAEGKVEHDPSALFIAGGARLSQAQFAELSTLGLDELRTRVRRIAEEASLSEQLRRLRRRVRREPLTIAVVLEYVLALRAELHDLARIIWGVMLGVPRQRLVDGLATP